MINIWFLIFPLKINEIMPSELFDIEDCKKGKGWKWRRKLFIHQPIISVIKIHILASPAFWGGQAMSRTQYLPIQMFLTLGSVWFKCCGVRWGMGCKEVQFWDVKEPKNSLRQLCLSTFMNLANWRTSHWDHCLHSSRSMGWVCPPSLSQNCLSGCRWVSRLPSQPVELSLLPGASSPIQPAWITLWLCLPLSADDRESPDGWHPFLPWEAEIGWDGSHPHCSHTANCTVKGSRAYLKILIFKIASSGTAGWALWCGGQVWVPGLNPAVDVVGHRENVQLTFLKVSTTTWAGAVEGP